METGLERIAVEQVEKKLRNLGDHIPNADDFLCDFGSYLADKLGSKEYPIAPWRFSIAYQLAITDLKRGGNYGKGEYGEDRNIEVPPELSGYSPAIYSMLRRMLPEIAEATCPPEFAKEAIKFHEEVQEAIKANKETRGKCF